MFSFIYEKLKLKETHRFPLFQVNTMLPISGIKTILHNLKFTIFFGDIFK